MRAIRKAFAAMTPVVMLSLLAVGVTESPAFASGCYGYSCHGYDMYHFGCTYDISPPAAAAVDARNVVLAYVYNRYSSGCKANWTEAQLTSAGLAAGDSIDAETFTTDSHGQGETVYAPTAVGNQGRLNEPASGTYRGSYSIYTDMVDGTYVVTSHVSVFHGTTYVTGADLPQ